MFKQFIINNKKDIISFLLFVIILFLLNIRLPFIINIPGGIIDVNERVDVLNSTDIGSLNMTYVRNLNATPITTFIALLNPYWDILNEKKEYGTSTFKESEIAGKINLKASENASIIAAFNHSNKAFDIKSKKTYVTYVLENAKTNLKVGDMILSIDNININSSDDIKVYLNNLKNGDVVHLEVINNNIKYKRYAKIIEHKNRKYIGFIYATIYDLKTNPKITINFNDNEKGPSGGLMLALTIYSKINNINLTSNLKIAGTGTIDTNGKVGEIGGIKYKLKGAVNNKMDIFLCPKKNYNEAIKEKRKHHYKIKIYSISTFDEAINYLKKLEN